MKTKIVNIPKILKKLGIQKNSKYQGDYEIIKRWLHYQPIDQADFDMYLKQAIEYIGI